MSVRAVEHSWQAEALEGADDGGDVAVGVDAVISDCWDSGVAACELEALLLVPAGELGPSLSEALSASMAWGGHLEKLARVRFLNLPSSR